MASQVTTAAGAGKQPTFLFFETMQIDYGPVTDIVNHLGGPLSKPKKTEFPCGKNAKE
jgi:hypothetical protein